MSEQSKHNVSELFKQLGKGSEKALGQIGQFNRGRLFWYIKGITRNTEMTEEVLSDILQAIWENRKALAEMAQPESWVVAIAHNKAVNKARNEKRNHNVSLEEIPDLTSSVDIAAEMESRELNIKLQIAEEKLNPREKLVFSLSKRQGLTRKQISKLLGVSENTVRNQLRNALRNIQIQLSKMSNLFLI